MIKRIAAAIRRLSTKKKSDNWFVVPDDSPCSTGWAKKGYCWGAATHDTKVNPDYTGCRNGLPA